MPGDISFEYLRSVCEAFPLASEASYAQNVRAVGKTPSFLLDASTQRLADSLEEWLRPRARGHSLESLQQIRDIAWFDGNTSPVEMTDYTVRLAKQYLVHRGGRIALCTEPQIDGLHARYRWLSLLVPADLLVAARSADMPTDPTSDHIDLLTPHLTRLLEKDVAETHLHVGAATSFHLVWIGLMTSIAHCPPNTKALARGGKPPFGTADRFLGMLHAAAVTRLLLASFLWHIDRLGTSMSFDEFVQGPLVNDIAEHAAWPAGPFHFARACAEVLRMTAFAVPSMSSALIASVHRHLLGLSTYSKPKTTDRLLGADPLAAWLEPSKGVASTETRFTRRGIRYLLGAGRKDHGFALAFWQYQRIRSVTFRHLTVEPGTAGLGWFRQHYDRISPLRASMDCARFDAAVRNAGRGIGLAAIEMRTAPESSWAGVRDLVREAAVPDMRDDRRPEVGLILHFLKQHTRSHSGTKRLNADPQQRGHGCRFGAYSFDLMKQAAAIEMALEHRPELLVVLCGIDVASDELAVPTWVFVSSFERIRIAACRAASQLARTRSQWNVTPLHATYHAGEDFRRLVEGIRRMHELLEFGLLYAGDRIGHGLAAGVDAEQWTRHHPVTVQPTEERLNDLLWEIDRYKAGHLRGDASRIEQIRSEAFRLACSIYDSNVTLDHLAIARQKLHQPMVLQSLGHPFVSVRAPDDPIMKLVHRHLTDTAVFIRGQIPLEIRADEGEQRMLSYAGRWLRGEIARREMTIEANPTSNLLIYDMEAIDTHPAFRFQPLRVNESCDEEPVQLSINTDDPISFATCLADEYTYLYGALLRSGIGAHDALRWLAARRDDGFRSRFTIGASRDLTVIAEMFD